MKSINSTRILVVALCAIILIGIAGCGGTETETAIETFVQITEPANNTSTQQNTIHILGKVENTDTTMAKVTVNGKEQKANIVNGSFDVIITIIDGNNIIKVSVNGVSAQVNITKIKQDGSVVIGKDGALMVLIPAGEFQMGSNDGDPDEEPIHTLYIDAFYMDVYEVTNAQYKKFVQATGHEEPKGYIYVNNDWVLGKPWSDKNYNGDNQPVICVAWEDAKAYAKWAGKRLPTEAEWEKATRGGLVGMKYPWGDNNITHDDANYEGTGGKDKWKYSKDKWEYTSPVGSFAPNGYDLYDIVGNVWEWCADWYDQNYYAISPKSNPIGPITGKYKVVRGGSWYDVDLRIADRNGLEPTYAYGRVGFRCCVQ